MIEILLVFAIIVILALLISRRSKENEGERIVKRLAKRNLNKDTYHVIHDVILPSDDGTTQIDHIIVSKYGVFVIETKDMTGWIFGNKIHHQWTQVIYGYKTKFQNPLHQNYKHVKTLQKLLSLNDEQIHSVVVFVGDSTFKTDMPMNVTQDFDFIRYVKSLETPVITEQKIIDILSEIDSRRLAQSARINRKHIKHVQSIAMEKQFDKRCPICGSPMMLRTSKKGDKTGEQFWGCSQFPKCRGTAQL